MKIPELYPERQGRPYSQQAISLDRRGLGIPDGAILPVMLSSLVMDRIVTYEDVAVSHEGDMVYHI